MSRKRTDKRPPLVNIDKLVDTNVNPNVDTDNENEKSSENDTGLEINESTNESTNEGTNEETSNETSTATDPEGKDVLDNIIDEVTTDLRPPNKKRQVSFYLEEDIARAFDRYAKKNGKGAKSKMIEELLRTTLTRMGYLK